MKVNIEGIWYPHRFGGWRILVGNQTVGIEQEFADAESEASRLRKAFRNL